MVCGAAVVARGQEVEARVSVVGTSFYSCVVDSCEPWTTKKGSMSVGRRSRANLEVPMAWPWLREARRGPVEGRLSVLRQAPPRRRR